MARIVSRRMTKGVDALLKKLAGVLVINDTGVLAIASHIHDSGCHKWYELIFRLPEIG